MVLFKLKYQEQGTHVRAKLFVGPDEDHMALSGELCFRKEEWSEFLKGMWVLFQIPSGRAFEPKLVINDPWMCKWLLEKEISFHRENEHATVADDM
jgi:hypothetical protein